MRRRPLHSGQAFRLWAGEGTEGHCSLISQMHMFAFALMLERKSQSEVSAPAGRASGFDCKEVSFLADFPKVTAKHDRKLCRWGREKTEEHSVSCS